MMWDYTKEEAQKQAKQDPLWQLERLLTYGLEGNRVKQADLVRFLPELKLTKERKAFLELLVWDKRF